MKKFYFLIMYIFFISHLFISHYLYLFYVALIIIISYFSFLYFYVFSTKCNHREYGIFIKHESTRFTIL